MEVKIEGVLEQTEVMLIKATRFNIWCDFSRAYQSGAAPNHVLLRAKGSIGIMGRSENKQIIAPN